MQKIDISDETLKENKSALEDLITAAHNNAKSKLREKTNEEISKTAGGFKSLALSGHYKYANVNGR